MESEKCAEAGRVHFFDDHVAAIHCDDHMTRLGLCRPIKDGEPIPFGSVLIERSGDEGRVIYGHAGPAKVASPEYRTGWDRTFGAN